MVAGGDPGAIIMVHARWLSLMLLSFFVAATSSTSTTIFPSFTSYVNLDARLDRRAAMEAQLNATQGLAYERFAAVDTRNKFGGRDARVDHGAALGCALSHVKLMRAAVQRHHDAGGGNTTHLILEDDFSFRPVRLRLVPTKYHAPTNMQPPTTNTYRCPPRPNIHRTRSPLFAAWVTLCWRSSGRGWRGT